MARVIIQSESAGDLKDLIRSVVENELKAIEFVNVKDMIEVYNYPYHYQDQNGDLVFRYDMAPHHRELQTFTHHKHVPSNRVVEAACPSLVRVLDEIDDRIEQRS